jgi:hypothetical protein
MQSYGHAVRQSCSQFICTNRLQDYQTARLHDKIYLIPVIPKTWQETWQDFSKVEVTSCE